MHLSMSWQVPGEKTKTGAQKETFGSGAAAQSEAGKKVNFMNTHQLQHPLIMMIMLHDSSHACRAERLPKRRVWAWWQTQRSSVEKGEKLEQRVVLKRIRQRHVHFIPKMVTCSTCCFFCCILHPFHFFYFIQLKQHGVHIHWLLHDLFIIIAVQWYEWDDFLLVNSLY